MNKVIRDQKDRAARIKALLDMPGWDDLQLELADEAKRLHTKLLASSYGSDEGRDAWADERAIQKFFQKVADYSQIKS